MAYLDAAFRPVPPARAAFVKIIHPDGRVVFAVPVRS